jgi:hypothetical protein
MTGFGTSDVYARRLRIEQFREVFVDRYRMVHGPSRNDVRRGGDRRRP